MCCVYAFLFLYIYIYTHMYVHVSTWEHLLICCDMMLCCASHVMNVCLYIYIYIHVYTYRDIEPISDHIFHLYLIFRWIRIPAPLPPPASLAILLALQARRASDRGSAWLIAHLILITKCWLKLNLSIIKTFDSDSFWSITQLDISLAAASKWFLQVVLESLAYFM